MCVSGITNRIRNDYSAPSSIKTSLFPIKSFTKIPETKFQFYFEPQSCKIGNIRFYMYRSDLIWPYHIAKKKKLRAIGGLLKFIKHYLQYKAILFIWSYKHTNYQNG